MACNISSQSKKRAESLNLKSDDSLMVASLLDRLPLNVYDSDKDGIILYQDDIGIYAMNKNKDRLYVKSNYEINRLSFFENSNTIIGTKEEALNIAKTILPNIDENEIEFISRVSDSGINKKEVSEFFGKFSNSVISINESDGLVDFKVLKHEIVHKVINEYMSLSEKDDIFNYVRSNEQYLSWLKYNNLSNSDYAIEEYIADYYSSGAYSNKISTLIDNAITTIRKLFTGYISINKNTPLDLFYRKLNSGYYKEKIASYTGETKYSAKTFNNTAKNAIDSILLSFGLSNSKDQKMYYDYDKIVLHSFFTDQYLDFASKRMKAYSKYQKTNPYLFDFKSKRFNKDLFIHALNSFLNKRVSTSINESFNNESLFIGLFNAINSISDSEDTHINLLSVVNNLLSNKEVESTYIKTALELLEQRVKTTPYNVTINSFFLDIIRSVYYKGKIKANISRKNIENEFPITIDVIQSLLLDKSIAPTLLLIANRTPGINDYLKDIINSKSLSIQDLSKIEDEDNESDLKRTIEGHKDVDSSKVKMLKHMMYLYGISTNNVITVEDIAEELSGIDSYADRVEFLKSIKNAFDSRNKIVYNNNDNKPSKTIEFVNSLTLMYNQTGFKDSLFFIDYNSSNGLYKLKIQVKPNEEGSFNVTVNVLNGNSNLSIGVFGRKISENEIDMIGNVIMKDIFTRYKIQPKFNYSSVIESEVANAISSSMVNDAYHGLLQVLNSSFIDGTVFEPNLDATNNILQVKLQSQSIAFLSASISKYLNDINEGVSKSKDVIGIDDLKVKLKEMFPRLKNLKGLKENNDGTFEFKVTQSNFRKKSKIGRSVHSPVNNPTSLSTKVDRLERIFGAVFQNGSEAFDEMNPLKQALTFIAFSSQEEIDQFPLMAIKDRGAFLASKLEYKDIELINALKNLSKNAVSKVFPNLMSEVKNVEQLDNEQLLKEFRSKSDEKAELFLENVISELTLIDMSDPTYIKTVKDLIASLKKDTTLEQFKEYYYNTLVNNILTHSDVFGNDESSASAFKNTATYFKRAPVTLTPGTLSNTQWYPQSYLNEKRTKLKNEFKDGIKVLVVKNDTVDLSKIFSGISALSELASGSTTPMDGATFYRQDTMEFMKEFHNVDPNAQSHKNVVSSKVGDTHFQLKHNAVAITQDLIDKYPYYKAINAFMVANKIHVLTTPDSAKVYNKETQFVEAYSIHDIMTGKAVFDDVEHAKKIVTLSEDQIISLNTLEQKKDHVTHAKQEKVMFFKGIGAYSNAYGNFLKYHYANYETNSSVNKSELINRTIRSTNNESYANGLLLSDGQFPMFNPYAMMTAAPSLIAKTFRDVIAPKLDGLKGLLHPDFGFVTFADKSLIDENDTEALKNYDKQLEEFNKLSLEEQEYLKMYNSLIQISDDYLSQFPTLVKIKQNLINTLTQEKIDSFDLIRPSGLDMFDKNGLSTILLPDRFKASYDKLISGYKLSNPNATQEDAVEYASGVMIAYGSRIPNTSVSSNRGYKVGGFITGERVVVPWLVMAVSGHDNDGDALFTHLMAMNNNDHIKFINRVREILTSIDSNISDLQSRIDTINNELKKDNPTNVEYLKKMLTNRTKQIEEYNKLKASIDSKEGVIYDLAQVLNKYDLSEDSLFGMLSNGLMENENVLEEDITTIKSGINALRVDYNVISYNSISESNVNNFFNNAMSLLNHNKAIREKAMELGKDSHLSETLAPIGFALFNKVSDKDKFNAIKDVESASEYMKLLLANQSLNLDGMKYFDLLEKIIELNDKNEGFVSLKEFNKILTFSEAKLPSIFDLNGIIDSAQDSKIQGIAIGFIAKMLTSFNASKYYNGKSLEDIEAGQDEKAIDISNKINLTTNAYIDALKEDTIAITGIRNPSLLRYLSGGILTSRKLIDVISLLKSMPAKALERENYEKELSSTLLKNRPVGEEEVDDEDTLYEDYDESGSGTSKFDEKTAAKYQIYTFAKYALINRNREKKKDSKYEDSNNFRLSLISNSGVFITSLDRGLNFKASKDYLDSMSNSIKTIFGSSITDSEMESLYSYLETVFNNNPVDIDSLVSAASDTYNEKDIQSDSIFSGMSTENAIIILKLHALNRMWEDNKKKLEEMNKAFKENSMTKFSFIDPPISILDTFNRIASAIDYINSIKLSRGIENIDNATPKQLEGLNHIVQIAIGYVNQYSSVLKALGFDPLYMHRFISKNNQKESYSEQVLSETGFELLIKQWNLLFESIGNSEVNYSVERYSYNKYYRRAKNAIVDGAGYGTLFTYSPKSSNLNNVTFQSRLTNLMFLYMDTNLRNNGIEPLFKSMQEDGTLFEYGIADESILENGRIGYKTETLDNIAKRTSKNIKDLVYETSYLSSINGLLYISFDASDDSLITLKDSLSSQELLTANKILSTVLNSKVGTVINENGKDVTITEADKKFASNLLVFAMTELYPAGVNPMHILFYNRPEFDHARNPYSSNTYSISTDVAKLSKEKNSTDDSQSKSKYEELKNGIELKEHEDNINKLIQEIEIATLKINELKSKIELVSGRDFLKYETKEDFRNDINSGKFSNKNGEFDKERMTTVASDLKNFDKLKETINRDTKEIDKLEKKIKRHQMKLKDMQNGMKFSENEIQDTNSETTTEDVALAGANKQNKADDCL